LKVKREYKIGILAFVSIFLFVWGLNYLKGRDIFSKQLTFYAVYDNVSGLIESNPVSVNGVIIGQISSIRFMPDGSGRILVESIISQDVPIPVNSISMLTGASLTGSREIVIVLGDAQNYIQNRDTLTTGLETSIQEEVSQLVLPIKQKAEELFGQIDSVMIVFQAIFNENTRVNITKSFENIQETLLNLKNTTGQLDATLDRESNRLAIIMANAESISTNLKNNNETLTNIITNFSNISDSLSAANIKQTMLQAEQSLANLNQVITKINQGEGSIGLLVNDEKLYNNLEASSKQLELLLEDIRKNPGGYIRFSVFGGR
jgi:phospholipid/cholesterol/gamma-HCH transport system substrate-binding protein